MTMDDYVISFTGFIYKELNIVPNPFAARRLSKQIRVFPKFKYSDEHQAPLKAINFPESHKAFAIALFQWAVNFCRKTFSVQANGTTEVYPNCRRNNLACCPMR